MLEQHNEAGADVTLATLLIDPDECRALAWSRWTATAGSSASRRSRSRPKLRSPYNPEMVSGSMGIYIFNTDVLIPVLLKDAEDPKSSHDFGQRHPAEDAR